MGIIVVIAVLMVGVVGMGMGVGVIVVVAMSMMVGVMVRVQHGYTTGREFQHHTRIYCTRLGYGYIPYCTSHRSFTVSCETRGIQYPRVIFA